MIEKKQVQHIAQLARLTLNEKEEVQYQQDLSQILDYFDILQKVETKSIVPMTHAVPLENVVREDIPKREKADVVLRMTQLMPILKDGFLKVKTILSWK
ncbi:MAG: Asp-tRNA(Asn)/Glu-tRNA(Gln) amidotransferase subunit GatC [bacterium]|nr:Asp-tRNA(Asn)/Glu-tRNA(Gln) amidotransferase subunit GatC [bacterium]